MLQSGEREVFLSATGRDLEDDRPAGESGLARQEDTALGAPAKLRQQLEIAQRLARAITLTQMQQVYWQLVNLANNNPGYRKGDKWVFPDDAFEQLKKLHGDPNLKLTDAWGQAFKLVRKDKQQPNLQGQPQLAFYQLVSAGPDGKFGTADDITLPANAQQWGFVQLWWQFSYF